jgi:cephalosporin-C deacetylase-like acetyl esterase
MYPGGKDKIAKAAFDFLLKKGRCLTDFKPASMETVQNYIDTLYQYDKTPLNSFVESTKDLGYCILKRVSYDASYPERISAVLLLPKNAEPPYQTCVWFPGSDAVRSEWKGELKTEQILMVKSGRAVLIPFYQATYNRRIEDNKLYQMTIAARNINVQRALDLRRSIDFIEWREDLDAENIAYVGFSWGASIGPVMMAIEDRIKTGVYLLGGLCGCYRHPAYDAANFTRFVKAPVIMLNGRDDSTHANGSQDYFYNTLGTAKKDKKHVRYPGGHSISWEFRDEYNKTILDWLDRYLGSVELLEVDEAG